MKYSFILKHLIASFLIMLSALINTNDVYASIEITEFQTPQQTQRYQSLIAELRCLVCQNQNLADSDAELAKDLRKKTAKMILRGKSNQQILNYMQERYGDFILYRPPFNQKNIIFWLAPIFLLLFAVFFLFFYIKKLRNMSVQQINKKVDIKKAQQLLNDENET